MPAIDIVVLPRHARRARHEHRVEGFSRDYRLLESLRELGVDREGASRLADLIASRWSVEAPLLTFHRGRGAHTGYCVAPRDVAVARHGNDAVIRWESANGAWAADGMIRLGDPTSLATIAHEFGHHLVHHLDPVATAAHGTRWVRRFDDAAETIRTLIRM